MDIPVDIICGEINIILTRSISWTKSWLSDRMFLKQLSEISGLVSSAGRDGTIYEAKT